MHLPNLKSSKIYPIKPFYKIQLILLMKEILQPVDLGGFGLYPIIYRVYRYIPGDDLPHRGAASRSHRRRTSERPTPKRTKAGPAGSSPRHGSWHGENDGWNCYMMIENDGENGGYCCITNRRKGLKMVFWWKLRSWDLHFFGIHLRDQTHENMATFGRCAKDHSFGGFYGLLSQLEKPMRKSPLPEVLQRDCRSPSCQALLLLLQWPDVPGSQGNPQDVNTATRFFFQVLTAQHIKILDSKERFPQHVHRWQLESSQWPLEISFVGIAREMVPNLWKAPRRVRLVLR